MRSDYSSSSHRTASTSATHKSARRKPTREQLERRLKIVGTLSKPLPSELPSPPASRSPSPAPSATSSKRKMEHLKASSESHKRPRLESAPPSNKAQPRAAADAPGPSTSTAVPLAFVPMRRPRRGKPTPDSFNRMWAQIGANARQLKYSGEARYFSTHPPSSSDYRPLPEGYTPSDSYRTHAGIVARLELLESVLGYVYMTWLRETASNKCMFEKWNEVLAFLATSKRHWGGGQGSREGEEAYLGLCLTLESCIYARMASYLTASNLTWDAKMFFRDTKALIEDVVSNASQTPAAGCANPPSAMLPSPASITTNSANSTPTATASTSSPAPQSGNLEVPQAPINTAHYVPPELFPAGCKHLPAAADKVTVPMAPQQVANLSNQVKWTRAAATTGATAQEKLNLPVLFRHFPRTFARVIQTTLRSNEDYEPDFDDNDGELFWPSQLGSGEGLAWMCLVGKAMVNEFGRQFEYQGAAGAVPRPGGLRTAESSSSVPTQTSRR